MDYSILKEQILDDIKTNPIARANSTALNYMIQNNTANYQAVADYSKVLGDVISESINKNIPDGVPDNELGAFADECLVPVYNQSQGTMLSACKSVQRIYNKQANIGLNPADVPKDTNRTDNIANRFKEAINYDEVKFLTNENVARSITRGAVNDSIRSNSKMQSDAGLKVRISRTDGTGCCDWCAGLVGDYDSFDKLPSDFWKVHRNCNCVIDYNVGKTNVRIRYIDGKGSELTKVTEKIQATSQPVSAPLTNNPPTQAMQDLESLMKANNVDYRPVTPYATMPTNDEIINRISGGDMTNGSCASLCMAYMGNKDGLDVIDFRGGNSQEVFSRNQALDKIFSLDGVVKYENKDYNGIKGALTLLKQMDEGKEYCLIAGKHASMVRSIGGQLEYLELQSPKNNGWTKFDGNPRYTLKTRFGATQSRTSYGFKLEQRSTLVEADSLKGNQEFHKLLGYINTEESKQKKGAFGFVK